jgi:hypothetical protein
VNQFYVSCLQISQRFGGEKKVSSGCSFTERTFYKSEHIGIVSNKNIGPVYRNR